jgi:hypothetical protein
MTDQLHDADLRVAPEAAHHHPGRLQPGSVGGVHAVVTVVVLDARGGAVEGGGSGTGQDGHGLLRFHERAGERGDDEALRSGVRLGVVGVLDPEDVARELDDRVLEATSGSDERHPALPCVA